MKKYLSYLIVWCFFPVLAFASEPSCTARVGDPCQTDNATGSCLPGCKPCICYGGKWYYN